MNHLMAYENFDFMEKPKKEFIFRKNQSLTEDELFEMANLWGNSTGLDNIVIWVGSSKSSGHGNRIKVSNLPDNMSNASDCFTITIPDLEIIGDVNKKHITKNKMNKIFRFIELNKDIIIDICQERIDTKSFVEQMKMVDD